jgi:hypothetical protein
MRELGLCAMIANSEVMAASGDRNAGNDRQPANWSFSNGTSVRKPQANGPLASWPQFTYLILIYGQLDWWSTAFVKTSIRHPGENTESASAPRAAS